MLSSDFLIGGHGALLWRLSFGPFVSGAECHSSSAVARALAFCFLLIISDCRWTGESYLWSVCASGAVLLLFGRWEWCQRQMWAWNRLGELPLGYLHLYTWGILLSYLLLLALDAYLRSEQDSLKPLTVESLPGVLYTPTSLPQAQLRGS